MVVPFLVPYVMTVAVESSPDLQSPAAIPAASGPLGYLELTKPELTGLSVLTALCGFYLGSQEFDVIRFFWAAVATLALGGGLGALNQSAEVQFDAMMKRTERRPLPSRRLSRPKALAFGLLLVSAGLVLLAVFGGVLALSLGLLTLVTYLFFYTPLKRVSWLATLVGAVPGALPPLIGWALASGKLSEGGWILFAILYFWQIPHFLSLAWMYKKDYARAGFKPLPVVDESGARTGWVITIHAGMLILVSILTIFVGMGNEVSLTGSVILGAGFLASGILFLVSTRKGSDPTRTNRYARRIFFASLIYLPSLMLLLTFAKS